MEAHPIIVSVECAATLADSLEDLARSRCPDPLQIALLEHTLDCAEVRPSDSIAPDVVTLYCAVRVADLNTGTKKRYTIVSPELADMAKRLLSVIAPLGIALLGHKQGDLVEATVPGGIRVLKIERVHQYPQPRGNEDLLSTKNRLSALSMQPA